MNNNKNLHDIKDRLDGIFNENTQNIGQVFCNLAEEILPDLIQDEELLWSLYSKGYQGLLELSPYRELQEKVALEIMSGIDEINISTKKNALLILGCASGNLEKVLKNKANTSNLQITGIDFSKQMLDQAKAENPENIYLQKDLNNGLPVLPEKVDRVALTNVLEFLKEPKNLFQDISKNMNVNGKLIISTQKSDFKNTVPIIREHLEKIGVFYNQQFWDNFDLKSLGMTIEKICNEITCKKSRVCIVIIALCNLYFSLGERKRTKHFSGTEIKNLCHESGLIVERIESVYADQYIMAVAAKETEEKKKHN